MRVIQSLTEVAQNEWDVLVTRMGVGDAAPHLFALVVEGADTSTRDCGWADVKGVGVSVSVNFSGLSVARELEVPADLPAALHTVVVDWLAPAAQAQTQHRLLQTFGARIYERLIRPFLRTSGGNVLAGSFRRTKGRADCWCLPSYVTNLLPWATVALPEWRELAPDRFPQNDPWQSRAEWRTPGELALISERTQLENAQAAAEREFQDRLKGVDERLRALSAAADSNERALLTSKADILKNVVIKCLRHLGFVVEDMDPLRPQGDKLEDLQVRDPDYPDWIALAEVRGYARGAQLSDLMRMQRFATRFQKDNLRLPDRLWYVVNHSILTDPSDRQSALASNPNEVQAFAESGGLVIDTVELFKLVGAVDGRLLTPADARSSVHGAAGRFTYAMVAAARQGVAASTGSTK